MTGSCAAGSLKTARELIGPVNGGLAGFGLGRSDDVNI